jgi:translation initiation factor IF-2
LAEKKLRIHHLAKELLVKSKTIIEKCEAEGIEIKNHMHVVSAGLEATIREWFSEGAHKTTLEESQRIDLMSVRVRPKKTTRKAAGKADDATESGSTATAVAEPPAKEKEAEAAPAPVDEPEPVEATAAAAAPTEPAAPEVESPASMDAEPAPAAAAEIPKEEAAPVEPEVSIAGPQNVPRPAKLSGPKVIRIDKAEQTEPFRPRTRPTSRPPLQRPPVQPPDFPIDEIIEEDRKPGGHRPRKTAGPAELTGRRSTPRRGPRDNLERTAEELREWRERDLLEMRDRLAQASGRGIGGLRAVDRGTAGARQRQRSITAKKNKIELTEPIRIRDFSRESGITVGEIVRRLESFASINSIIDTEQAHLIATEFEIELKVIKPKTGLDEIAEEFAAIPRENAEARPPVVTVLGHVDHGKTSLLDHIRQASVTAGEAGGITQHIGAYRVKVGDKWVTFLDTPGHAAFTAMRARGANLTDVVVLVVAADDGVMPTTIEAINHAKAAGATIVVALNKIDLHHDLNKIYGQLTEQGLTPSGDWGGDTDVIKTSAITGEGIDDLLAHLATLSDVLELKADPTIPATGTVVEAERSERIGNIARVLVQEGTLKAGQIIVCGSGHGRVRAMKGDHGDSVRQAGPSTPVEVTGLSDLPEAGDKFYVLKSAKQAKEIAEEVSAVRRKAELTMMDVPTSLESVIASAEEGEIPELSVIIRADVQGSADALKQELAGFPADEVKLNVMHSGVGMVTESDIELAKASRAIIIAFHTVPDPSIQKKADNAGVEIRSYRIIYEVVDEIKKALEGLLEPEEKLESRGRAEVREIFSVSKVGKAAGCFVRDGVIARNHQVRVIRDGVPVTEGASLDSLRRFKDDVKEVKTGFECGIRITGFDDIKPGDIIEAFELIKIPRTLATRS